MTKRKVYIAGHMLNRGSQLLRAEEAAMVREAGHSLYVPQENKEINDKTNAVQEGLAERILRHDTDAIFWSDTVLIEPDSAALGTHVELGQILGMTQLAEQLLAIITENDSHEDNDPDACLTQIYELCRKQTTRKVLPHLEDIRRVDIPEVGDRRSFSVNQYVYGACLKLTDGKGFYSMEEVKEELK